MISLFLVISAYKDFNSGSRLEPKRPTDTVADASMKEGKSFHPGDWRFLFLDTIDLDSEPMVSLILGYFLDS